MFQNVHYGHQFLVLLLLLCKFPLLISVLKPWIRVIDITNRLTPYATGLQWQQQLMDHHISLQDHQEKRTNNSPCAGTVLCLQHSHVYTLGSGTDPLTSGPFSHVDTVSGQFLEYETVKVDRGGQATYHGPGQLVLYPILDLVGCITPFLPSLSKFYDLFSCSYVLHRTILVKISTNICDY